MRTPPPLISAIIAPDGVSGSTPSQTPGLAPCAPMRTVVLSDLHIGTANDSDLLRRPSFLARLIEFVEGADRLVLLGDVLELRDRPLARVVELAGPVFEGLGRAV